MFRYLAITVLMLAVFACQQSTDVEQAREDIRAVWDSANRALEAGDWEAYSEVWAHTDYIQVIHPGSSDWLSGWDEVRPPYKKLLEEESSMTIRTRDMRIRVAPSGDMAWATMKWDISSGEGEDAGAITNWGTGVFEKIDGEWKMVHGLAAQPAGSDE